MDFPVSVTIGNFDGVHLGHRRLIETCRKHAGTHGRVVVFTFEPHPLSILRPRGAPARLTTFDDRRQLLQDSGADEVVRLAPTPDLLSQSPEDFIRWLVDEHRPTYIVEGPGFRFGRARAGSIETIRRLGDRFGYQTKEIEPVEIATSSQAQVVVSSTMIRWLIERGRVIDACRALGRAYHLSGRVIKGDQRGRELGMPTANLDAGDLLLPADGIYAGVGTDPSGHRWPAAISVGVKPTFGEHPRTCEAHLLGYDGPLDDYGWVMRLEFNHWLRDQIAYRSVDALLDQLNRDFERTRTLAPV